MKFYQTEPLNIRKTIIGIITKKPAFVGNQNYILISDNINTIQRGFDAVLTSLNQDEYFSKGNVVGNISASWLDSIDEGDIVCIEPTGNIKVLWEVNSKHNSIMVTNQCNCQCVMCPQPSGNDPEDLHHNNLKVLQLIKKDSVSSIGLTGGEPTIHLDRCIEIIRECKRRFPEAAIALLTNGRFLNCEKIEALLKTQYQNLTFCIPLHADNSYLHDQTTNCPGSFAETVTSIQNLALYRQKIEIRVVITKYNYQRLQNISDFIYRNFPFCVHVAFMGMEVCGLASENMDEVWIDPYYYIDKLCKAVKFLYQRNFNVSIYNIPLCLLPENYWRFAADSISDWKKGYIHLCNGCFRRDMCPGLFLTSKRQSEFIKPFEE